MLHKKSWTELDHLTTFHHFSWPGHFFYTKSFVWTSVSTWFFSAAAILSIRFIRRTVQSNDLHMALTKLDLFVAYFGEEDDPPKNKTQEECRQKRCCVCYVRRLFNQTVMVIMKLPFVGIPISEAVVGCGRVSFFSWLTCCRL